MKHFWLLSLTLSFIISSCGVRKDVYEARKNKAQNSDEFILDKSEKPKFSKKEENKKQRNYILEYEKMSSKYFITPIAIPRDSFVNYAKKFEGVRYKYGGVDTNGMDCSGFVYRVFQDFGVKSPRVSADYYPEGKTIKLEQAKKGDIILFTGSNHESGKIGHMGIITNAKNNTLEFIHSASGGGKGVMISKLEGYWQRHFVKIISVLK